MGNEQKPPSQAPREPGVWEKKGEEQPESLGDCSAPVIIHTQRNAGFPRRTSGPEGAKSQTGASTGANARQAQSRQLVDKEMGLDLCLEMSTQDLSSPVVTKPNKKPHQLGTGRLLLVLALQPPAGAPDKCHCFSGPVPRHPHQGTQSEAHEGPLTRCSVLLSPRSWRFVPGLREQSEAKGRARGGFTPSLEGHPAKPRLGQ